MRDRLGLLEIRLVVRPIDIITGLPECELAVACNITADLLDPKLAGSGSSRETRERDKSGASARERSTQRHSCGENGTREKVNGDGR